MLAEIGGEDVADRIEVGAAVMGDDALRISRGARGVAERDGVPFILGKRGERDRRRQRVLIFDSADPLPPAKALSSTSMTNGLSPYQGQRLGDHAGEFRIDQDDLGAAVIELEGD